MKKTRKSLIFSAVSLLLCFAMLLGTTYAWFTDSVTSTNNVIKTGSLDLQVLWTDDLTSGSWKDAENSTDGPVFAYENWEPGYTAIRYVKIVNNGSLAFKYALNVIADGDAGILGDVIDVYYVENASQNITSLEGKTKAGVLNDVISGKVNAGGVLLPEGETKTGFYTKDIVIAIALHMQEDAGNEYQDQSVGASFAIQLIASQYDYESDDLGEGYDKDSQWPNDVVISGNSASAPVTPIDNKVPTGGLDLLSEDGKIGASIPEGVAVVPGTDKMTLTVGDVSKSEANITLDENEAALSIDVHVSGVAESNTVPVAVTVKELLPVGLNMGNYRFYHVEDGNTVEMVLLEDGATPVHNNYEYDPATGDVVLYLASFSEVALVAEPAKWEGNRDYSWYNNAVAPIAEGDPDYVIANADQLAAFSAIVGGMDGQTQNSFEGKTVKLVADINLGDKESENNPNIIFYPIGYNSDDGKYEKTGVAVSTGFYSFMGTFDGNGNTISNFYQNTWEMKGDNNYYDATLQYYRDGMGLFGKVYGGTVKNLTVANFSSDGEYTTTGVIAAYADGATFENIAITNCNPRVYNIGNGGIVGCVGWYAKEANLKTTFTNITVDNSNKISALWGSYDVACGGIVGQYYPTSGQTSAGTPKNAGIDLVNCHVSAQMDVYNDVCGNYQYYAYRYAGMIIGSIRENTTNEDGKTIPDMTGISATGCTVNYGDWNDYYYCEFEKNGHPSYSGPDDYKFSRVPHSELNFTDSNGNGLVDADERASVTGCKHNHTDAENNPAIYLPFHQLFTGYGWGVNSIGLEKYSGIVTNLDITEGDQEASVEKFETKFTGDYLYKVGNVGTVSLGTLFAAKDGATINSSGVWVKVESVDENVDVGGTFSFDPTKTTWDKATIQFNGTGVVKVTIQDYNFCKPTVLLLEVVDAVNATGTMSATKNNVVLLNDIGTTDIKVSDGYTFYGNGFKVTCSGKGYRLKVAGMYGGFIEITNGGVLDNVRVICDIYPSAFLYAGEAETEVNKNTDVSTESKIYYNYQLSAVAMTGNGSMITNSYIYGARNNIYVGDGNVTIENTTLKNGVLANIQIKNTNASTVTLRDITTIQEEVVSTYDSTKTMLGCGILVGDITSTSNPNIVIQGTWNHHNWVIAENATNTSSSYAKEIINAALKQTNYLHTHANGVDTTNLALIVLNNLNINITDSRSIENNYLLSSITMNLKDPDTGMSGEVTGQVYSVLAGKGDPDAAIEEHVSQNRPYKPNAIKDDAVGGNQDANDGGDDSRYCYWDGELLKLMYKENTTPFTIDVANLIQFTKFGFDLNDTKVSVTKNGAALSVVDGKATFTDAGTYIITYQVTDPYNYDKEAKIIAEAVVWTFTYEVEVSFVKQAGKTAEINVTTNSFYGSYGKTGLLEGTDYHYCIPFMKDVTITDYAEDGVTASTFDATENIINIEVAGDRTSGTVTFTYLDGRVLIVTTSGHSVGLGSTGNTISLKSYDDQLWITTDGVSNNATTGTWKVTSYKFTGNNGVSVEYTTARTCNFDSASTTNSPQPSWSNYASPSVDSIKYTVTYDGNGGMCTKSFAYATTSSTSVILPTPERSGYIFNGWYTAVSGGTRVGGAGDSYTPSANITLYAQWGKPCIVTYNANGGSCEKTTESYNGDVLTLPNAELSDYVFIGWYDALTDGKRVGGPGEEYCPNDDITLYAYWQKPTKVTYDANGGECGTESESYYGDLKLPTPIRTGYTFNGWYTAASGGTKIGDAGASYAPSADITLYAQWQINSYTITVTTSEATVSDVTNGQSIEYGSTVEFKVSFNKSDKQTVTVTDANGGNVAVTNTNGIYSFTMPASNVTINASSKECVTADTLITLADGTQVRVDSLTGSEELLVWNMETGKLDKAPIMFVDSDAEAEYEIVHLYFSDGTDVKVIYEHGFWDYDLNKYVYLDRNAADYIGHTFAKQNGDSLDKVELVDVVIETQLTTAWSPVTAGHLCYFVNGMLSMPGGISGLFNIFEVDPETMTYDFEAMQKDIETYGLYTYEELNAICPLSEEMFNAAGGAYLKISIGKGNLTIDELIYMINRYSKFFD